MSDSGGYDDLDEEYIDKDGNGEDYEDDQFVYLSEPEDDFCVEKPTLKQSVNRSSKLPTTLSVGGYADFKYTCIAPDELMSRMEGIVRQVNDIFELPACSTRILLSHFKWDKERLLERFYDGDQDKLFKEVHIVNPFRQTRNKDIPSKYNGAGITPGVTGELICDICFLETLTQELEGLECQHLFCIDCWRQYLRTRIEDNGNALAIPCPESKCDILVNEDIVYRVMKPYPQVIRRFQYLSAQTFVQQHKMMKWCPSPGCTFAVEANSTQGVSVACLCGHRFCFGCSAPAHEPVRCFYLSLWSKKCEDDSETAHWIHANTKQCPKCKATIEKSGGCNHMVCRNVNCKADFCWVCLGPWEPHGSSWYNCNRYNESSAKHARDGQAEHRHALERYLFYYNRYVNHMKSLRFEDKLYSQIEAKMRDMQHLGLAWIETQFLKNAVDSLCHCRNTLMYTYVFAFFLSKNNHSILFEDNQRDLEMATEILSEYLEREITTDSINDIKVKVQDKSTYCERRRQVLLDSVFEGYESDVWEFKIP